jgi:low temperature requirement protein LtrA
MSKVVMVALWFLVGLVLLVGGLMPSMTRYCLIVAGILVIILAIVLIMKKKPETDPAK